MHKISLEALVETLNNGGWVRKAPSKKRKQMEDAEISKAEIIDGILYLRNAKDETIVALESERLEVQAHESAGVPFDMFVSGPRMVKEMRKKIEGGDEHFVERVQILLHLYNGTNLSRLRTRRLQDFFGRGVERVMDGKLIKMLYHDAGKALEIRFENAPSIMLANVYDAVLDQTMLHLKVGDEVINLDTGEESKSLIFDFLKK